MTALMERMTVIFTLLAASVLVASCATVLPGHSVSWTKPGASDEQIRTDYGLCGGNFDVSGRASFKPQELESINRCMESHGYRLVEG
ncbi:MAG: hypothetical protein LC667_03700 [Thioalkalivibrio sp.]|nr:hypothetical protein [Thioalkalivibrio sp.]